MFASGDYNKRIRIKEYRKRGECNRQNPVCYSLCDQTVCGHSGGTCPQKAQVGLFFFGTN